MDLKIFEIFENIREKNVKCWFSEKKPWDKKALETIMFRSMRLISTSGGTGFFQRNANFSLYLVFTEYVL